MRKSFKNVAAATTASLMLLASGPSNAQQQLPQEALRYVDAEVSYNFGSRQRTVHLDCENMDVAFLKNGKKGLTPRVAFVAQFDLLPDEGTLARYNSMQPAEKEKLLSKLNPEEQDILTTLATLPSHMQRSFYLARNDKRLLDDKSALELYMFLENHVKAVHGVKNNDFGAAAKKCKPYFGLE